MVNILMWIWQLPQNLIGCIIYLIVRNKITKITELMDNINCYHVNNFPGGISLGNFIFLDNGYIGFNMKMTLKHEYGHCRQSRIVGPMYLLVVGLPSICRAIYFTLFKPDKNYYSGYPENWADELGKVKRL